MIPHQEICRVARLNRLQMIRTNEDEDGVNPLSISIGVPALRINELMLLYPLDSTQEIDDRCNNRLNTDRGLQTDVDTYIQQCEPSVRHTITLYYNDNVYNAMTIGFFTGLAVGAIIPPGIATCFMGIFGGFIVALISIPMSVTLGIASGALGGLIKSKLTLQADPTYLDWVKQQTSQNMYEAYKEYLHLYLSDQADDFLCPISQDFPVIPFISPNGHVYDKEAIFMWLDSKEREIYIKAKQLDESGYDNDHIEIACDRIKATVCPMRGPYFTKEQLTYCYEFVLCMRRKLDNYMKENDRVPPIVAIGIETYLLSLKRTQNMITSKKIILLTQRMFDLGMPECQQESAIQRLLDEKDDFKRIA